MFSLMGKRKFCFELKSAKTCFECACKLFLLQPFSLAYFSMNPFTLWSLLQGNPVGQSGLGMAYLYGRGVQVVSFHFAFWFLQAVSWRGRKVFLNQLPFQSAIITKPKPSPVSDFRFPTTPPPVPATPTALVAWLCLWHLLLKVWSCFSSFHLCSLPYPLFHLHKTEASPFFTQA